MKNPLISALGLVIATLPATGASLVGLWEFSNPGNIGQATVGADLVVAGTAPAYSASLADDAANSQSGVITTNLGVGNHLVATNPIGGNGGGALTNQYSLLIDMQSPLGSRGTWRSLYQTNPANTGDGDLFIRNSDTGVGVGTIGYSPTINDTVWNRYVITFDAGSPVTAYLNGSLLHTHGASSVDDRFGLNTTFLLFGDEDNENNSMNVGTIAFWNGALSSTEVAALGIAGSPVPEPAGALLLILAGTAGIARRRR